MNKLSKIEGFEVGEFKTLDYRGNEVEMITIFLPSVNAMFSVDTSYITEKVGPVLCPYRENTEVRLVPGPSALERLAEQAE